MCGPLRRFHGVYILRAASSRWQPSLPISPVWSVTACWFPLTRREREAVALVAQGLSNDEVAEHMVISPLTAKTHINRAMAKLRTRDRAQLVVLAYESGLVTPRSH